MLRSFGHEIIQEANLTQLAVDVSSAAVPGPSGGLKRAQKRSLQALHLGKPDTSLLFVQACMLIPATVIIYTFHGGLIATFISAYLHTVGLGFWQQMCATAQLLMRCKCEQVNSAHQAAKVYIRPFHQQMPCCHAAFREASAGCMK